MKSIFVIFLLLFSWCPALEIHEELPNEVQEKRAKILGAQLLCPTCGGQALNESAIEEAALLRAVIRGQLVKGYSDQQVIDWFVDRYGERILIRPPLSVATYALWFLPWFVLFGFLARIGYRRYWASRTRLT